MPAEAKDQFVMNSVDHLNAIIDAWEALPGGKHYKGRDGIEQIDKWLNGTLHPAIVAARTYLGRKTPDGQ
jgi:hypothetical protein